jgi:hypothetical protein
MIPERMRPTHPAVLSLALLALSLSCSPPPQGTAPAFDGASLADWAWSGPEAGPDAGLLPDAEGPLPRSAPPTRGTYVVLAADPLAAVGAEIAAYRRSRGYATRLWRVSDLVSGSVAPRALVAALHGLLAPLVGQQPTFLLLLGDAPGPGEATAGQIPAATCTSHYGGCWTDNVYGDLDGDGLPDLAVGRIPARSARLARSYLAKLKQHEGSYAPGLWNRRLSLYTGQAGFSPQIDALIEMGMMEGLKRANHAFDVVGAYNNPKSPYYYQPFTDKVVDLFNQGNLFVIYVGHGMSGSTSGLNTSQLAAIHCAHRLPGVFFIACSNGDYVGEKDSIAEALLRKADGAIVAFAASDISHPYANAVLLYETMRVLLDQRPITYGEALRRAKHALVTHADAFRALLDAIAVAEVPSDEQPVLRAEHVNLFNLFGDPAAAIGLPRTVVVFDPVVGSLKQGALTVSGTAPGIDQGTALVTLEVERDALLFPLDPVDPDNPDTATVQANWSKAVDKVVTGVSVPVAGGAFSAELSWTPPLPGKGYVKVYAASATTDSFGVVVPP